MNKSVSLLWREPTPSWVLDALDILFDRENCSSIYFRADDIGISSNNCTTLFNIFRKLHMPLHLALVPRWLDTEEMGNQVCWDRENPLWHWQMHGYAHFNHARNGKKMEFGVDRTRASKLQDIEDGVDIFRHWLGRSPRVFTPPWNRCDAETLALLAQLGFYEVSRFYGAEPVVPSSLVARDVCVDLHTGKERDNLQGWKNLLVAFQDGLARDNCGVMLHHERMNDVAFTFLEWLLKRLHKEVPVN